MHLCVFYIKMLYYSVSFISKLKDAFITFNQITHTLKLINKLQ